MRARIHGPNLSGVGQTDGTVPRMVPAIAIQPFGVGLGAAAGTERRGPFGRASAFLLGHGAGHSCR